MAINGAWGYLGVILVGYNLYFCVILIFLIMFDNISIYVLVRFLFALFLLWYLHISPLNLNILKTIGAI